MVDAGINTPVIGVAFDGTGYGTDGLIWGGEFLVTEFDKFERKAHIQYLPLAGGNIAIMKPYRIAIGYLISLFGEKCLNYDLPFLKLVKHEEIDIISRQMERSLNSPLTSSCGRLFDAVSALLSIRGEIQYDSQAAVDLEMMAWKCNNETGNYPVIWKENNGIRIIDVEAIFQAIIQDILGRVPTAVISARFHNTIARMIFIICQSISAETGIKQVTLTGGVFQNRYLLKIVTKLLKSGGFLVLTHRQVPCNDGGISLGQAVIGGYIFSKKIGGNMPDLYRIGQ
jgi:hydrogenase maturation protein HypF